MSEPAKDGEGLFAMLTADKDLPLNCVEGHGSAAHVDQNRKSIVPGYDLRQNHQLTRFGNRLG